MVLLQHPEQLGLQEPPLCRLRRAILGKAAVEPVSLPVGVHHGPTRGTSWQGASGWMGSTQLTDLGPSLSQRQRSERAEGGGELGQPVVPLPSKGEGLSLTGTEVSGMTAAT